MSNPSKHFEFIRLYPKLTSDPITGKIGEIYYNSTQETLRICLNEIGPVWANIVVSFAGLGTGTADNSAIRWDSGTSKWVENDEIYLDGNSIHGKNINDFLPANSLTLQSANNSGTGDGGNLILNAGTSAGGSKGELEINSSSILLSGNSIIEVVNDSNVDSNPAQNFTVQASNKTAGSGDGGNLILNAGTSVGGNKGKVIFNGSVLELQAVAAADPLIGLVGQLYYNTTINAFRYYNGTQWITFGDFLANGSIPMTGNLNLGSILPDFNSNVTLTDGINFTFNGNFGTNDISTATGATIFDLNNPNNFIADANADGIFEILNWSGVTSGTINYITGIWQITFSSPPVSGIDIVASTNLVLNSPIYNKIINLTDPTSNQDAATKKYVDTETSALSDLVNALEIETNGLLDIEITERQYQDSLLLKLDGSRAMQGDLDMDENAISFASSIAFQNSTVSTGSIGAGSSNNILAVTGESGLELSSSSGIIKSKKELSLESNKITNLADGVDPTDAVNVSQLNAVSQLTNEPTGFADRNHSELLFNDNSGTPIFTIQPKAPYTSFDFYVKGIKFTKSSAQTVTTASHSSFPYSGNNYFYFDETGALQVTNAFDASLIQENAIVSIVYWNEDTGSHTYFAEERHALTMDGATHAYLHTVFGARYLSGLSLNNFNTSTGYFDSDSGQIRDEDLLHSISAESSIPVLYRQGSHWRKKAAGAYPLIYPGSLIGYAGATIPYNQYTGGAWQLTAVQNNKYVLMHYFATNDIENGVIGIQGIAQYDSVETARTAANTEIVSLGGLPFAEFVPIGTVIFQTNSGYASPTKGVIQLIDGGNYVDFRGTQLYVPAGSATTHGLLSGLSNDDHIQYILASGARSMFGNLDMGTHKVTNVVDPTSDQDAATKKYVDTEISAIDFSTVVLRDGSQAMTGNLNMGEATPPSVVNFLTPGSIYDNGAVYGYDSGEFLGQGVSGITGIISQFTLYAYTDYFNDVNFTAYIYERGIDGLPTGPSIGVSDIYNTASFPLGMVSPIDFIFSAPLDVTGLDLVIVISQSAANNFGFRRGGGTSSDYGMYRSGSTLTLAPWKYDHSIEIAGSATSNRIINVADPTSAQDAATKNYVDSALAGGGLGDFMADGSVPMTGDLNLNSHYIQNVLDPSLDQDAATKKYVDDALAGVSVSGTAFTFAGFDSSGNMESVPGWSFDNVGGAQIGAQNSLTIPALTTDFTAITLSPTVSNTGLTNFAQIQINPQIDQPVDNYGGVQSYGYGTSAPVNYNGFLSQPQFSGAATNITHVNLGGATEATLSLIGVYYNPSSNSFSETAFDIASTGSTTTFKGINVGPAGDIDSFIGIDINPDSNGTNYTGLKIHGASSFDNVIGIDIDLSNATPTTSRKTAISINDGLITQGGTFQTTSSLPSVVDSGSLFRNVFEVSVGNPISGTDVMLNNMAGFMNFMDDYFSSVFNLGVSSVGFVSQVSVDSGKIVNNVSMLTAGVAIDSTSAGGTITDLHLIRAVGLTYGGSLTVDNIYGLQIEDGLSSLGTIAYGISVEDSGAENYLAKSLVIGGATKVVSDGSIGLEVGGLKSIRLGNLTTTQKDSLPNIAGAIVYDESLGVGSINTGTGWINFGGASGSGDFMADGSVPMTGDLDAGFNQISNVLDPILDQDAATKKYVDDALGGAGGDFMANGSVPMTGDLNMNLHEISDVTGISTTVAGGLPITGEGISFLASGGGQFGTILGDAAVFEVSSAGGAELSLASATGVINVSGSMNFTGGAEAINNLNFINSTSIAALTLGSAVQVILDAPSLKVPQTIEATSGISFHPGNHVTWDGVNLKDLADPVDIQDAATKNYVDNAVAGLSVTPTDVAIPATNIDWSAGDTFYKLISVSTTFTFSNEANGKTIVVIIKNTGASDITLTLPTVLKSGVLNLVVSSGKENIYTFVRSNGKTYCSAVSDFE